MLACCYFPSSQAHLNRPGARGRGIMPTVMPKESEIERRWFVVDAQGQVLGRLASRVASILRGKHKPTFTPHLDLGDHVVVINAEKIHLTGRKLTDKVYRWHTGYIGGLPGGGGGPPLRPPPGGGGEGGGGGVAPQEPPGRRVVEEDRAYR